MTKFLTVLVSVNNAVLGITILYAKTCRLFLEAGITAEMKVQQTIIMSFKA